MTGRPAQGPRWGATWDDGRLTARLWVVSRKWWKLDGGVISG